MRKSVGNLSLAGLEEIFGTSMTPQSGECVTEIAITELHAPDCHPFRVTDDEAMQKLVKSISKYGVREPGLVRPDPDGGYELLCGNRRKRACELAGIEKMPVIIRELDDDLAVIAMVDSNLQQREKLLPSEKAWAYKMKMEALNHSGIKADRHSCEIMAEQTGECKTQIFKVIRLTELIDVLLDKVDTRGLAFSAAVELSYLSFDEQRVVADCMEKHGVKPSLSQAVRFKKMNQDGALTSEAIDSVLAEEKKPNEGKPKGSLRFRKFFPPDYSPNQIEAVIIELLRDWKARTAL